jgi:hypothetical protein
MSSLALAGGFMNKIVTTVVLYLFISVEFVIFAEFAVAQTESERLHFEVEPGWKVGYQAEIPQKFSITEFIREGDDINNWKELLTIQNYVPSWGGSSPENALNELKTAREKNCPGGTRWNVIEKNKDSVLYEWQAKPCLGWPDQHEIARIIFGKYNRFVVRYTVKQYKMPDEQRDYWIGRFSKAGIETKFRKPPHTIEAEVKAEAQRDFETILDLWRDGKYGELLARTTPCSNKRFKANCEEKITSLTRKPACCWEKIRDVSITFVDEKSVKLKATIGLEGFGTKSVTKIFPLVKEDGVWKVRLEDVISLGQ